MREKKELNMKTGEQIRLARERAKMTQEQLAEQAEVSPQYISDLERGVVGLSVGTLKRVCLALCVSSDQILFSEERDIPAAVLLEKCSTLSQPQFQILSEIISKYIEAVHLSDEGGQKSNAL